MIKFSRTKLKYLTTAFVLLFLLGVLMGANVFAAQSFASIEQLHDSGDGGIRILEIVPKENSGSIGFYSGGQEPLPSPTSMAHYDEIIEDLRNIGLMEETSDPPRPLKELRGVFPWEVDTKFFIEYDVPPATTTVKGSFEAETNGKFKETPPADPADPMEYEYVGAGGGFDFTASETGTEHTVHYSTLCHTIQNNNWFRQYVFGDADKKIAVEVFSLTPSQIGDIDKYIKDAKIDMVVFSAGLDIAGNKSLQDEYKTNDITDAQLKALSDNDWFDPENEDALAVVFDTRLLGLQKPVTHPTTPATEEETNISNFVEKLNDYSGITDTSKGYVHKNIFAFAPNPNGSTTPQMAQLATIDFNEAYNDTSSFSQVLDRIKFENSAREVYKDEANLEDYDELTTDVTIATSIRHILDFTISDFQHPEIVLYDGDPNATDPGTEASFYLIPIVFTDNNTLLGSYLKQTSEIYGNFYTSLTDLNTYFPERELDLYYYYQDKNGKYYHDKTNESMLAIEDMENKPTENELKGNTFSRTTIPDYSEGVTVNQLYEDMARRDEKIEKEAIKVSLNQSVMSDNFDNAEVASMVWYVEIQTTIGIRTYKDLSKPLTIQKLGLLSLG